MTTKQRIRIVSDETGSRATDADTGALIHGVMSATITINADNMPTAVLQVLTEIDVIADGEVVHMRLNNDTGKYEEIE